MKNERIIKSTILKRKKTRKKNYKMKKTRKKNYKMKKTRKKIYKRKKTRKKLTFSGGDTSKIFELLDGKEDCNDIFRILENTLSSIQIRDIKKLIKKFNKYPIKKCNEKGMMREILYNKDFKYKILPEIIEILKGKVTTFNFIRHATSCNNSREGYYKMPLVKGGWDFDPALTYYGITKTIERAKKLKYYEKTTTEYRNVYVSNMLRTIQTATILFGYNLRDKLNLYICPYIKEVDKEDIFISKAFKNGILIKKKLTIKKRRKEWLDSNWMYEYIKEKVTQYFIFTGNYDYKYMIIQRDSIDVCIDISKKLINEFITFITNKINNNESIDLFSNYNDETYSQITQFLEKLKNNGFFGSDEYDNFDAGREYYKNLYNIALLRVLEEIKETTADIGNMPQKIKIMISQYIEFLNYLCIGYNNNFNTEITLHALIHKEIDNTLIIKSVVKFIFVKKNNKTYSLKNKKDDYLTNILNLEKNYFELKRSYPDLYSKSGDLNKFIELWLNHKNDIHGKNVRIGEEINIVTHSHVMQDYAKRNIEKIKSKRDKNKEIKIIKLDFSKIKTGNASVSLKKKFNFKYDIVINLIGYVDNKGFENSSLESMVTSIKINALIPLIIFRGAIKYMVKKNWGRIINCSSIGVKFGGGKNSFNYSFSKHCSEFLPNVYKDYIKKNILINNLRIGLTKTKLLKKMKKQNKLKKRVKLIPMKRLAEPNEISDFIINLIDEKNSYMGNQTISISGGE